MTMEGGSGVTKAEFASKRKRGMYANFSSSPRKRGQPRILSRKAVSRARYLASAASSSWEARGNVNLRIQTTRKEKRKEYARKVGRKRKKEDNVVSRGQGGQTFNNFKRRFS
jgi:hypothetical protein